MLIHIHLDAFLHGLQHNSRHSEKVVQFESKVVVHSHLKVSCCSLQQASRLLRAWCRQLHLKAAPHGNTHPGRCWHTKMACSMLPHC